MASAPIVTIDKTACQPHVPFCGRALLLTNFIAHFMASIRIPDDSIRLDSAK